MNNRVLKRESITQLTNRFIKKGQHLVWQWRGPLIAAPSIASLVILLRFIGLFQAWEWAVFDQYMRLRPSEPTDERIVIVGLTENDVQELGQSVVTDQTYADLLEKLRSQSPRAIGLDIYRDLPVEPGHAALTDIFNSTPNLVGIQKVVGTPGIETVAPPPALAAKNQVGANDLIVDGDNTVRRGLLSVQDHNSNTVYGLALYLALHYLDPEGISPETIEGETWQLGQATFSPLSANDGGYIRTDASGYQQLINYRGPQQTFETVSFADILNNRVSPNWATDKVVLIGAVGESFKDTFYTPYRTSNLLSLPTQTPGVEIHANLTSQIISAALENRAMIRSQSEPTEWAWIFLWSSLGALSIWLCSPTGPQLKQKWQRIGFFTSAIAALPLSTFLPFLFGWWIPVVPAILAFAGSATAVTIYLAHTATNIRRTFGRYLSQEIVTALLEDPEGQKLGGERRKITLLTSDLRGFTATSERLPPEQVIKVLNFYLGHMAEVITRYNGTIDEFMGDGILILFGAPIARADDAQRAIACAIDMQLAMSTVNQTITDWNLAPLEMGIGIHTGEVVVGNIGSEKRTKYGVVGSPVNLTYRIESFTTGGQVLISQETLEAADNLAKIRGKKEVKPKGIAQPITIYDIEGVGAPYNLILKKEAEVFYPLKETIPLRFNVLDGKHVNDASFSGNIVQLSEKGALLKLNSQVTTTDLKSKPTTETTILSALNNLKINLLEITANNKQPLTGDIYAKVLETSAEIKAIDPTLFHLRFTAKPPAIAALFTQLYQAAQQT